MLYNIRKGGCETNSSSMHSLCFNKENIKLELYIPEVINVEFGEFGWGYEELKTILEKLSYVITSIQYYDSNVAYVHDLFKSKYFIWLKEMVFEHTGSVINIIENDDKTYLGYVDHQSTDTLNDFWSNDEKEFKENMKNIIFNENCYIIIDNDN